MPVMDMVKYFIAVYTREMNIVIYHGCFVCSTL